MMFRIWHDVNSDRIMIVSFSGEGAIYSPVWKNRKFNELAEKRSSSLTYISVKTASLINMTTLYTMVYMPDHS